jgi:hypothetical protein
MVELVALVVLMGPLVACAASSPTPGPVTAARHRSPAPGAEGRSEPVTVPPVVTTAPTTTTTTTTIPAFTDSVAPVTAADVSKSWHPGCPVGPAELSLLHLSYWGFDDQPHVGTMVVATSVTRAVIRVFSTLYAERFPIRQMVPVDAYGGSDPASMAADNTSGFNCRYAVAPGPPQWSVHAYGEAIDVNTVENPYDEDGQWQPAAGAAFADRADIRPGMAYAGGELVAAFAAVGWQWGGRWTDSPDYQHFSATGG